MLFRSTGASGSKGPVGVSIGRAAGGGDAASGVGAGPRVEVEVGVGVGVGVTAARVGTRTAPPLGSAPVGKLSPVGADSGSATTSGGNSNRRGGFVAAGVGVGDAVGVAGTGAMAKPSIPGASCANGRAMARPGAETASRVASTAARSYLHPCTRDTVVVPRLDSVLFTRLS